MQKRYFPMFLDMAGKEILVFGAGKIAARRVKVLLLFGASITLVSPEISEEMQRVIEESEDRRGLKEERIGRIREVKIDVYQPGCIHEDMDYVLAVTNDEQVNEAVYRECRHREIPVNVASDQTKCDFYFPAVVETEDIIAGITSGGKNHQKVREIAEIIREKLK